MFGLVLFYYSSSSFVVALACTQLMVVCVRSAHIDVFTLFCSYKCLVERNEWMRLMHIAYNNHFFLLIVWYICKHHF